jgi:hypothetical protein
MLMGARLAIVTVIAVAACAAPAVAHDRLFGVEVRVLGRAHALAHEHERAALRQGTAVPGPARDADPGPPGEVGAWDTGLFDLPDYGIHAALLATGRVLLYGYPRSNRFGTGPQNHGQAWIWDPSEGVGHDAFHAVTPPEVTIAGEARPVPIFCSGLSFLPNGDVIVTGGNLELGARSGINTVVTFDPFSEAWHRQGDLGHGRWYPSQALTPDGRTVILGGLDEAGDPSRNPELEVWPAPGVPVPRDRAAENLPVGHLSSGDRLTAIYPHLITLRSGKVALLGPAVEDTGLLDPATWTWSDLPPLPGALERIGSNAVPLPGGPDGPARVLLVGGWDRTMTGPDHPATASTTAMTADPGAGTWDPQPPQSVGRAFANTVLLPDGTMVSVGGGAGVTDDPQGYFWTGGEDERLRHVELWDPATGTWQVGPAQQRFRTYHSIALLLPDGSVLSAGDDRHEDDANAGKAEPWIGDAEIYRPPYLFHGPRPEIEDSPAVVLAGERFRVEADGDVERAVLMAPSAVTHGADMSQRHVELRVVGHDEGGVDLVAPPSYAAAPPGQYMLFLLSSTGVPSVASFVRFGEGGDEPLPAEPAAAGPVAARRGLAGVAPGAPPRLAVRVIGDSRRAISRGGRLRIRVSATSAVKFDLRTPVTLPRRLRMEAGTRIFSLRLSAAGRRALRRKAARMGLTVHVDGPVGSRWVVKKTALLWNRA